MKTNRLVMALAVGCSLGLTSAPAKDGGPPAPSAPGISHPPAGAPNVPRPTPLTDHSAPSTLPSNPTMPTHPGNPTTPANPALSPSAAPAAGQLLSSMHDINQTAFNQRRQLIDTMDMRLKTSQDSLRRIQTNAGDMRGDARAEFMTSLETAKARERELNAAMQASRDADERTWETRRSALARAERDYYDAMARLESLSPRVPKP